MTTAHVEKFAELVGKDPALLAKLGLDKVNADAAAAVASAAAAAASAAAFIENAVKEAKALGLEFTEEEASAFMAAEENAAASSELSDTQLEAVAGGKGSPPPVGDPREGDGSKVQNPNYRERKWWERR
jgi:hypothetical protein